MFTEHCGRVRATSTASRLQNRASEMFETKAGLRPRMTSTGTELACVVGHTCVSEIIDILVVSVISTISVGPDGYFFFWCAKKKR